MGCHIPTWVGAKRRKRAEGHLKALAVSSSSRVPRRETHRASYVHMAILVERVKLCYKEKKPGKLTENLQHKGDCFALSHQTSKLQQGELVHPQRGLCEDPYCSESEEAG